MPGGTKLEASAEEIPRHLADGTIPLFGCDYQGRRWCFLDNLGEVTLCVWQNGALCGPILLDAIGSVLTVSR